VMGPADVQLVNIIAQLPLLVWLVILIAPLAPELLRIVVLPVQEIKFYRADLAFVQQELL